MDQELAQHAVSRRFPVFHAALIDALTPSFLGVEDDVPWDLAPDHVEDPDAIPDSAIPDVFEHLDDGNNARRAADALLALREPFAEWATLSERAERAAAIARNERRPLH